MPGRGTGAKGGRPRTNLARQFFQDDDSSGGPVAACLIQGCGMKIQCKFGPTNLRRHIQRIHPDHFQRILDEQKRLLEDKENKESEPAAKKKKISVLNGVHLSIQQVIDALTLSVTLHGRPFSIVDDEGIQEIVTALLQAAPREERRAINSKTFREEIGSKAQNSKTSIIEECKGQLVSLKVDGASRKGRSFIGINIQFAKNGQIQLRTLGINEIHLSHTGYNLCGVIKDVLQEYDIDVAQIYSVTIDNGSNMVKMASILQADQLGGQDEILVGDSEEEEEEDSDEFRLEEELEEVAQLGGGFSLTTIRCAAHTLQLAVCDCLKDPEVSALLRIMRSLCKYLRTAGSKRGLRVCNSTLKPPVLDCETRWSSTAVMLRSLVPLKDYVLAQVVPSSDTGNSHKDKLYLQVTEKDFNDVQNLLDALTPAEETTKYLQGEQITLGDFLGSWLRCKLKISKVGSRISNDLKTCMETRESQLFDNPSFASAIYLDPRYFSLLDEESIRLAEHHLRKVWMALQKLKQISMNQPESQTGAHSSTESPPSEENDELDVFLNDLDAPRAEAARSLPSCNIRTMLGEFQLHEKRVSTKVNILEWWEKRSVAMPQLYALAIIVLAAPATQASVERLFSGLKYVLSDLRCNLDPRVLNNVLLVRSNTIFKRKSLLDPEPESPARGLEKESRHVERSPLTPRNKGAGGSWKQFASGASSGSQAPSSIRSPGSSFDFFDADDF